MTKQQRSRLEVRLQEERDAAVAAMSRFNRDTRVSPLDQTGDVSAYPLHMADQGTDTFEQELDTSLAVRQSRILPDIEEAQRRLVEEPEQYGRCEVCGKEIAFERLELIPWARRCAEHEG